MQQKYIAHIKKFLLDQPQSLFLQLLEFFEIKELKKFPDFEGLKKNVIALTLDPQELFSTAICAIKKNQLTTIEFLIDECGYDLKNLVGKDEISLLHEACIWGQVEVVEYLLKKGFNPNQKNLLGNTPLHHAIQSPKQKKSPLIITLLKKHQADLDILGTKSQVSPLHLTVMYKNQVAQKKLIQLKANPKILWNGLDYLELGKAIEKGEFKVRMGEVCLSLPDQTIFEKVLCEYYKGIFSTKFNPAFFENVKAWLMKKSEKLDFFEVKFLFSAMVLTSDFPTQIEHFILSVSNLISKDKSDTFLILKEIFKLSYFFIAENQIQVIRQLNQFALNLLQERNFSEDELCDSYNILGIIYKEVGLFKESENALLKSTLYLKNKTDEKKASIFYNFGIAQEYLLDTQSALKNFELAFDLDKNDIAAFTHYLNFLIDTKNYGKSLKICKEANFSEYTRIFESYVMHLKGDIDVNTLLKSVDTRSNIDSDRLLSFQLKTECLIKLARFDGALMAATEAHKIKEEIIKKDQDSNIAHTISLVLQCYILENQYKNGLLFAESNMQKYPKLFNNDISSLILLALLYTLSGEFENAQKTIEKIQFLGINPLRLSKLYFRFAISILAANSENCHTIALSYLNSALAINPNLFEAWSQKLLIFISLKDQENAEKVLAHLYHTWHVDLSYFIDLLKDSEKSTLEETTSSTNSETDETEEEEAAKLNLELEQYDTLKIHRLCKAENARLENEQVEKLFTKPKQQVTWKVGVFSFQEGDKNIIPIFHPRYANCHAVIHPELNLDPALAKKCQSALNNENIDEESSNSSVDNQKTQRKLNAGVQTINNSVTQLKITGKFADKRPWTDKVYVMNGKHLLVFDRCDIHAVIKRKAKKPNLMQTIDLEKTLTPIPTNTGSVFSPISSSSSASTSNGTNGLTFQ